MPLYGTLTSYQVDGKTIEAIRLTIPYPAKVAYVRLPSSSEMLDYFKQNDKAKGTLSTEERTLALFENLRLDTEGTPFDEYEATTAIDVLTRSRGVSFDRVGDSYVITVETPFGNTIHTLKIPTQKQLAMFRRNSTKNYLNAVVAMYGELAQSIDGYIESMTPKEVPAYHQLDCVNQVFAALEALDPIIKIDPNA